MLAILKLANSLRVISVYHLHKCSTGIPRWFLFYRFVSNLNNIKYDAMIKDDVCVYVRSCFIEWSESLFCSFDARFQPQVRWYGAGKQHTYTRSLKKNDDCNKHMWYSKMFIFFSQFISICTISIGGSGVERLYLSFCY